MHSSTHDDETANTALLTPINPLDTSVESASGFYQLCYNETKSQASLSQMKNAVVVNQPIMRKSLFKVIILGAKGVGKTTLFNRLAKVRDNEKENNYKARTADFEYAPGETMKVEFVDAEDIAEGHSVFNARIPKYFDASGAIVLYDVTDASSFESLDVLIDQLRFNIPPDAEVLILGNKLDLASCKRATSFEEADGLAESRQMSLFEVSAKTGKHVSDAVADLIRRIRDKTTFSTFDVDCVELKAGQMVADDNNNPAVRAAARHSWCRWLCLPGQS